MGKQGCVELGHFDKHFSENTRKRGPQENILEFFLQGIVKTTFWMESLTQRWTQSAGSFFPKSENRFSNRTGEASPLPLTVPVWLNMHQYPWICLNILENAWKNSSDSGMRIWMICNTSSYMFDRLLKMSCVLNEHDCIFLNMPE